MFELSVHEKMKLLSCLMHQILTFATIRDEIDERFNDLIEAKSELRTHQVRQE